MVIWLFTQGDRRGDRRRDYLHVVNTRGDCRGDCRDDRQAATIAAIEQAIVQATRLRIVAAMQIISIKNKLDFGGLDGHNNIRFIAYGSQWLDWHKKENY